MDMQTGWNENRALLRGTAAAEPVLSHETHGVVYETFPLAVRRLSGSEDRVNVLVPRALLEQRPVTEGMELEVEGEVRSFNNKSGKGSRLVITLYAKELRHAAELSVCKINIDSDLRLTMTGTIRKFFEEHPDKFDPREYLKPARANIKDLVRHKLIHVLGCAGKA